MGRVAAMPVEFREQMTRLLGLKFAPSDMLTHWEALADVPADVLAAAVSRAQKTRVEFPSPAELRQDCDAVAHLVRVVVDEDRGVDVPPVVLGTLPTGAEIRVSREWRYYHSECGDSGVQSLWCGEDGTSTKPWQIRQACERTKPHEAHEWIRRCTCFDSNPELIRKRERQQKYAEAKAR